MLKKNLLLLVIGLLFFSIDFSIGKNLFAPFYNFSFNDQGLSLNSLYRNNSYSDIIPTTNWTIQPFQGNNFQAPYDFYLLRNYTANQTFYKKLFLQQGDSIKFWIKNNSSDCIGYCFMSDSPETYSKTCLNPGSGSIPFIAVKDLVPQTGFYSFLVQSTSPCQCTVMVNNTFYNNVSASNNALYCLQDTADVYNTFTWNSTGDVALCIIDQSGKVCAFNDNYFSLGDVSWGTEARIKKKFSLPSSLFLVFPSSDDRQITTDVYARCKNNLIWPNYFFNYSSDDAIQACPRNGFMAYDYNCFAWAGGWWFSWIDPTTFPEIEYNPSQGNYPLLEYWLSDCGYTSEGTTEDNSEIDVYQYDTIPAYPKDYSHMAIRCYSNNTSYGYGWESKIGVNERVMHPRYALSGNYLLTSEDQRYHGYGMVVKRYRSIIPYNQRQSSQILENVSFSEEENLLIDDKIFKNSISTENVFLPLYNESVKEFSLNCFNTVDMLQKIEQYRQLVDFCQSNPNTINIIYQKVRDGEIVACRLLYDVTKENNKDALESIRILNTCNNQTGKKIVRSLQSNAIAYIKALLYKEKHGSLEGFKLDETNYSDDSSFLSISRDGLVLKINYTIPKKSKVTLILSDHYGNMLDTPLYNKIIDTGSYQLSVPFEPTYNILFVTLIVDNQIFTKKIKF